MHYPGQCEHQLLLKNDFENDILLKSVPSVLQ